MRQPTRREWNAIKERRQSAARQRFQDGPVTAGVPDGLYVDPAKVAVPPTGAPVKPSPTARATPEHAQEAAEHGDKGRQFARYDETWRAAILAAGRSVRPATHRLVAVLLAEADFRRQIKASAAISTAASLTPNEKRQALEQLEKLGLIAVEWRGRGRVPIATPLHLSGRPVRK
jgi:hypothetical protein